MSADVYGRRPFRVLFSRLSTYHDVAESFTHPLLYTIARSIPGVFPDLAYLPPRNDWPLFQQDKVPWLLGSQSKRGPRDFDLIGFSNSIVQELINLPAMLVHSDIPLGKSRRMRDASVPLILLGGANALHTSVLWTDDPPVDGVFVGEAEQQIVRILEICRDGKKRHETKARILKRLESVDGFFQPEGRKKTSRYIDFSGMQQTANVSYPVPFLSARAGEGHVPISEGCPCFCSFCAESYGRKPYREHRAENVVRRALAMKAAMGLDAVELYSFNFNMHSEFYRILWDLAPLFSSIGLKSQRLDFIAHDPGLLGFIHAIGKSSLTCGIEGISERLRRYLGKNLPDEVLGPSLKAVLKAPLRELKIFLVATGLEKDEDFDGLKDLLDFMAFTLQYVDRRPRIIFSVTPLVRFPGTPLEFADAFPVEHMKPILGRIRSLIGGRGFEIRQAAELEEYWLSQVLVRAADSRITDALFRAIERTGFVYFQGVPAEFTRVFRQLLEESGLGEKELLQGGSFEENVRKPWAAIDTRVDRKFLATQYELAMAFKEKGYCLGRAPMQGKCRKCGACPDETHNERLTCVEEARRFSLEAFRKHIADIRQHEAPLSILVNVTDRGRGLDRRFVGAALARAIMQVDAGTIAGYRRYGGAFWDPCGKGCQVVGDDVLTLYWDQATVARIRERMKSTAYVKKINGEMDGWGIVKGVAASTAGEWTLSVLSPFAFEGKRYFETRGIRYTLRRSGEENYRMDFSADSLRKKIIAAMEFCRRRDGCVLKIVPGPKYEVNEFLHEAFVLPTPDEWVRIHIEAGWKNAGN
jgi:radical SAM superfamily enzyme YgiQ (UPF0313 family)